MVKKKKQPSTKKVTRAKGLEQVRLQIVEDLLNGLGALTALGTFTNDGQDLIELARMVACDLGQLVAPHLPVKIFYLSADQVVHMSRVEAEKHQAKTGCEFLAILAPSMADDFVKATWSRYFRPNDPHAHFLKEVTCAGNCDTCGEKHDPAESLYI